MIRSSLESNKEMVNANFTTRMVVVISISFVIAIVFLLFWWPRRYVHKTSDFLNKVPEPPSSLPFLGVALDFSSTKVLLTNLMQYTETCGEIVKAKIGPIRQFLLVTDYKLLEHILSSTKLLTKSYDYHFLRPWLGDGLLTSDGAKWKNHRRVLTPAFHFKILEQFVEIFESGGDKLVKKFEKSSEKTSLDVYPFVTLCALDVICESIMGTKINAQNGDNSKYVKSVKDMCRIATQRGVSAVQMYDLLYPFSKNYYNQKKVLKILHDQSNEVIYARQKELRNKSQNETCQEEDAYFKNKKAFLDLLLQTKISGRPLTHEEIRDEVDTFMFEGHDTTASALSFTLFCLASHSDVQNKAFEEQRKIFPDTTNAAVTYADLQNMKYLELVIKESLRLYPSVPLYNRDVVEDIKFGDEIIPKGITLVLFAFGVHRNSKYFEDPLTFKPERFENADGKLPYAYIPFSAGPRNCIGQKFAMLEMKSIISKVLRSYELLPAYPHHELQLVAETILKSDNGIKIGLQTRK